MTFGRDTILALISDTLTQAGHAPFTEAAPGFRIGAGRVRCDGTLQSFSVGCKRRSPWGEFEHVRPDLVDAYQAALAADGWDVELDDVETYVVRVHVTSGPSPASQRVRDAVAGTAWDAPECVACHCPGQLHDLRDSATPSRR